MMDLERRHARHFDCPEVPPMVAPVSRTPVFAAVNISDPASGLWLYVD
jgi:hypothetical protein